MIGELWTLSRGGACGRCVPYWWLSSNYNRKAEASLNAHILHSDSKAPSSSHNLPLIKQGLDQARTWLTVIFLLPRRSGLGCELVEKMMEVGWLCVRADRCSPAHWGPLWALSLCFQVGARVTVWISLQRELINAGEVCERARRGKNFSVSRSDENGRCLLQSVLFSKTVGNGV